MPIDLRNRLRLVARAVTSTPSKVTLPSVGSSNRLRQRRKVLLPEPDGPMMNTNSRSATLRSMSFSTSLAPKLFLRPETVSIAMPAASPLSRARRGTCPPASTALRLARRCIIARSTGNPGAGIDGHRRRVRFRFRAEPALVHGRHRAILFHAFNGVLELCPQRQRILAQRHRPHQAGGMKIGQL